MGAFHAVALNFQQKGACWSPMLRKLDHVFDIFLRKQRHARGDPADYWNSTVGMAARSRWNGQRPRLKSFFLKIAFPFQRRNVVLNRCRINSKMPADFSNGRRKTVALDVLINEVQDGLLSLRQHASFIPEQMYGSQM